MATSRGHRPPGHNTRGIHKHVGPVVKPLPGQSKSKAKQAWSTRPCPRCGKEIPVRRFVSQKAFREHVKSCAVIPTKN
jgi:hypothetical protein